MRTVRRETNSIDEIRVIPTARDAIELEGGAMVEDQVLVVASCSGSQRPLLSNGHGIDLC